jgi:RimJ/RimL family protein N-acetyltransferase
MTQLIELETARLRLRQWTPADRAPLASLNADRRVMEHLSEPLTREASDALADRFQALLEERGWGFWVTEDRASGQFAGFVGLHIPSAALPFSPCVEIGWRLAAHYWGRGLATEAARKIPGSRFMPIIMLSTESEGDKKADARSAGVSAWLTKPFKGPQLIGVVKMVLF